MSIIALNKTNFDEVVQSNDCVVVEFWAKWCGPCLAFAPVFESLSQKFEEVVFAKVDIDAHPRLAEDFNVRSVPYLMIFRREFAVFAQAGVQTASTLSELIEQGEQIDIEDLRAQLTNIPKESEE